MSFLIFAPGSREIRESFAFVDLPWLWGTRIVSLAWLDVAQKVGYASLVVLIELETKFHISSTEYGYDLSRRRHSEIWEI
jgi:hypothetical protein